MQTNGLHRSVATTVFALLLVLVVALAPACNSGAGSPSGAVTGDAVTVTDSSGRSLTFAEAPRRIVSYSPGATEILFAVGAGARVVAVDRFSDYPAETASLPKLEYARPAPEPVLALAPDLVIMAGAQEGQIEQFRRAGLTVLHLSEPKDITGVIEQVRLLGRVTHNQEKAEALAADMERRVEAVRRRVASVSNGPLVFYELTPDGYTVAPDSFIGAMLTLVKAGNVARGAATAFPQISVEVIIAANPDVIILADAGDSGGQSLQTVRARPGWSGIKAVQNGAVYEIDADVFSRPGPRIVEALEQLVKLLYPGL